ncbi:MAG: zinc ribbon domain-containing protein [Candidatus Dormibacteria bacterium]
MNLIVVVAAIGYGGLLWVAIAYTVVRDARRRSASSPFLLCAGLLGFVPPFLGALIYLVIRPPRTIEEDRSVALEEAAFLQPISDEPAARPCPTCGRDIEQDFVLCPYCRTQFGRRCQTCDRTLRLGWPVCPYCAEDVGIRPVGRTRTAAQ